MRVRFWGVRGSLPTPLLPSQVRDKLAVILSQALPEDLADGVSRERFIAGLPSWLFGTVGGNTACVSISTEGCREPIIFDCGSGMKELGNAAVENRSLSYHVFLSHFHWDHLQGLPFFGPVFDPEVSVNFYSPRPGFREALAGLMYEPYSPVSIGFMPAKKNFRILEGPISIGDATVSFRQRNHPGGSFAYRVSEGGKSFIYATDSELCRDDFDRSNRENAEFFANADVAVLDSQYTLSQSLEKAGWGHSAFSMAVEFASIWKIKHLVLFHFDPASMDRDISGMLHAARRYEKSAYGGRTEISIASEGMEIVL